MKQSYPGYSDVYIFDGEDDFIENVKVDESSITIIEWVNIKPS